MGKELEIAGEKISPGKKQAVNLKISEFYSGNPVNIPVIVTRGKSDGPVLFVSAAIHGDEINGTEIVRQFNALLDPEEIRGTIVCVPIVNIFGFYSMTRIMPDNRDLNRSFPGSEKGSATSRIAKILFDEIISKCDYGIDFHTPRSKRFDLSHTEADIDNEDAFRLAKAFGQNIIIKTSGPLKSLQNSATSTGIPTIVFSGGEVLRFNKSTIRNGLQGLINVLIDLDMKDGEMIKPEYIIIVKESRQVHCLKGGMLRINVNTGDLIYKDNLLGKVYDPYGHAIEEIKAPENGIVISITTNPLLNPGNEVCSYVMLDKSLSMVEHTLVR